MTTIHFLKTIDQLTATCAELTSENDALLSDNAKLIYRLEQVEKERDDLSLFANFLIVEMEKFGINMDYFRERLTKINKG